MRTTLWSSSNGDIPANLAFTNNLDATTNPSSSDDRTKGYQPGSVWVNTSSKASFTCVDATAGAAVWSSGGGATIQAPNASTPGDDGGEASVTGGAGDGSGGGGQAYLKGGDGGATGNGGYASLYGGNGGSTSGQGGDAVIQAGDAINGDSNGGNVEITAGLSANAGIAGSIRLNSTVLVYQSDPAAVTVSGTLTADDLAAGIITVNQGGGAASNQQLPVAGDMDALFNADAPLAVDFSVINVSTNAAEDATITTNTGWTLVGSMAVASNAAATDKSSGRFRARKTGPGAWTLYRLA